ncbi:hypothetical protein HYV10_03335 [Candidatus Dependentiae bacterium]|nr:hypothetical protein [Candidatus Dependentiae bacterium]
MERVKPSRPFTSPQKLFVDVNKKIKKFDLPLTDFDLINLHSMFMESTYSAFQASDINTGRIIIQKILNSLNYYHDAACLSTVKPVYFTNIDIFTIIQKYAQVYGLQHAINQFFIEYAQIDFIWIELTESLISCLGQSNINYFIKIMTQHRAIPVIIIEYNS